MQSMCRNKLWLHVLPCAFLLTGCTLPVKLVTDTGSGKQQEIAREDYLLLPEAENRETPGADDHYQVLTLEKGTFTETALRQTLNRTLSLEDFPSVRLALEEEHMKFGTYMAEYMDYVEVGDVLATVYVEKDPIAVEEARMALTRLQERFGEAEAAAKEELEEMESKRPYIYNSYEQQIADIRYRQRQLDWENESYRFNNWIAEAKKRIDKLAKVGEVYEVKADRAGYVLYETRYSQGTVLHEGDYICHIMDDDKIYLYTDMQAEQMPYGKEVEFETRAGRMPGRVVNGGQLALYGNLDTDRAVFRLYPEEGANQVNRANLNSATMNTNLKTIQNVIVVPKQAVTVQNEKYYVTLLREDGSLVKTQFLPGGSNVEEYWVLRGLSEGMQIVYK